MAPRKSIKATSPKSPKEKKPEVIKHEKTLGPFDFINAVSFSKEDLIRESDLPDQTEKLYNPFLTNRSLSYHVSSIMDADMMNQCSHLPKQLQFDGLLNMVRKQQRWSKWFKPEKSELLQLIAETYQCNLIRAQEILSFASPEWLESFALQHSKGGRTK